MAQEELALQIVTEGLKKFMADMSSADLAVGKSATGWQKAGKLISKAAGIAFTAVAAGAAAAAGAIVATIPVAADFESSLAKLEIAASGAELSFEQLRTAAIAVGADTKLMGVSASGASEAMTGLYKAGLTTTEIFGDLQGYMDGTAELGGALRASIDLAAATELDMVQASELASVALATFGGELETSEERADFINKALNNMVQAADASVAEVSDLAAALQNIGPVAAQFGFGIEDVNNALAILSTRGIRGAEAGTALKSMLTNIMRPTDSVKDALRELNVSLYDQQGALKPLPQIIGEFEGALYGEQQVVSIVNGRTAEQNQLLADARKRYEQLTTRIRKHNAGLVVMSDSALAKANAELANATGIIAELEGIEGEAVTTTRQLTEEQRNQYIQTLAGTYGMKAMNTLLQEGTVGWNAMANATDNAAGIQEQAARMTETFKGKWEALLGILETVAISIGSAVLPGITELVSVLSEVVEALLPPLSELLTQITPIVTEFASEIAKFVRLLLDGEDPLTAFKVLLMNLVPPEMFSQVMAIVDGIAEFVGNVKTAFEENIPTAIESLNTAGEGMATFWQDTLLPIWDEVWTFIQDLAGTAVAWFEENLPLIQETGEVLVAFWEENIVPRWENAMLFFQAVTDNAWNIIKIIIDSAMNTILSTITLIMQLITGDWTGAWETIKAIAIQIWDNTLAVFTEFIEMVLNTMGTTLEDFNALWRGNWETAKEIVTTLWEAMKEVIGEKLAEIVAFVIERVAEIKGVFTDVDWAGVGSSIISAIASGVRSAAGRIAEAAASAVRNALAAARAAITGGGGSSGGSGYPGQPGYQQGGTTAGGSMLVGEAGPELLTGVPGGANVISAPTTARMLGGGGTTVNNYNLTTNALTRPGGLRLEFAAMEMGSR